MTRPQSAPSLLVVSGLRSFAADPWQDWLEHTATQFSDVRWVRPQNGEWPDADRWADRIDQALAPPTPSGTLVLAHGFGALAVVRHAVRRAAKLPAPSAANDAPDPLRPPAWSAAILLAPAMPQRFSLAAADLDQPLGAATTLVAATQAVAEGYPWLHGDEARHWARRWGCDFVDAGGGPRAADGPAEWPLGRALIDAQVQKSHAERHPPERHAAGGVVQIASARR